MEGGGAGSEARRGGFTRSARSGRRGCAPGPQPPKRACYAWNEGWCDYQEKCRYRMTDRAVYRTRCNMLSASQNPQVVREYLECERDAGRVLGPMTTTVAAKAGVPINRFGVIPKPTQPGKWRLIVDLLHPSGY